MKTPYEYRAHAREALNNHWGEALTVSIVISIITTICSIPSLIGNLGQILESEMLNTIWWKLLSSQMTILLTLLFVPVQYALSIALLHRTRGSEENLSAATFEHTKDNYGRFLAAAVVINILVVFVGLITLAIGAVVLGYVYRMVPYLLSDYPELSIREAMKISREMMRGYKWKLFMLDLSFIGWYIVGIMTCGIGMLLVTPYIQTATALFYDDLKNLRLVETED